MSEDYYIRRIKSIIEEAKEVIQTKTDEQNRRLRELTERFVYLQKYLDQKENRKMAPENNEPTNEDDSDYDYSSNVEFFDEEEEKSENVDEKESEEDNESS
jgi:hypothetical protein